MKTLYLMRHAKSSWDYPELADYDRPLNRRGKRDSPHMASWLSGQDDLPQKIISSGAKRARKLAEAVQSELGCDLEINDDLYSVNHRTLLKLIHQFDDDLERVMVVGHNPEMTSFIKIYTQMTLDNLPTSGLVRIRYDVSRWAQAEQGEVDLHMWPKLL